MSPFDRVQITSCCLPST